jgi:hypothetical protein
MSEAKFIPEYAHLENKEVLNLQILIDNILAAEREDRQPMLDSFEEQLNQLYDQYKQESNHSGLRDMAHLIQNQRLLLSKLGLDLERSRISILVDQMRNRMVEDGLYQDDEQLQLLM